MIKFVRQKSRDSSLQTIKPFLKKKGESNDSGTESDIDVEKQRHTDFDMETSLCSCADANSPTDTACSSESSAMLCQSNLLYDQHSSEEELEVINGSSSVVAGDGAIAGALAMRGTASSLVSERGTSSLEPEDFFGKAPASAKRSSSTLIENRKRSLAHSSDDELRNFLEPILTPVNFRTSPPLEAFKPNRSHMYRSTTPLILSEARCGIENIKLCDNNSVNEDNGDSKSGIRASCVARADGMLIEESAGDAATTVIKVCHSALKMSRSSHHIYQPQPKYNIHYNSSRSSPASTTGLDIEVRSVSPPAKLFHCAISPRRRPMRVSQHATHTHRLQRPHRPCLDFDKMQQVSL